MPDIKLIGDLPSIERSEYKIGGLEVSPLDLFPLELVSFFYELEVLETSVTGTVGYEVRLAAAGTAALLDGPLEVGLGRYDQRVAAAKALVVRKQLAQTQDLLAVVDRRAQLANRLLRNAEIESLCQNRIPGC